LKPLELREVIPEYMTQFFNVQQKYVHFILGIKTVKH
jgi:hypothetical protein